MSYTNCSQGLGSELDGNAALRNGSHIGCGLPSLFHRSYAKRHNRSLQQHLLQSSGAIRVDLQIPSLLNYYRV